MATDIRLEAKHISHCVWKVLNDAEIDVVGAKEFVDSEDWDLALKPIGTAIVALEEARDTVRAALKKHGVKG